MNGQEWREKILQRYEQEEHIQHVEICILYFIVAIFRLLTLTIRRERYEILMVDNIQIDDYLSLKSIIVIVTIPLHVGYCYFYYHSLLLWLFNIKEKKKNVRGCTKMIASLSLLSQFGVLGTVVTKLVTK